MLGVRVCVCVCVCESVCACDCMYAHMGTLLEANISISSHLTFPSGLKSPRVVSNRYLHSHPYIIIICILVILSKRLRSRVDALS
jgi:hypothetical protein